MHRLFVFLLIVSSATTLAQGPTERTRSRISGFYAGGGITQNELDVSGDNDPCQSFLAECDDDEIGQIPRFSDSTGDDTGGTIHGGYRINRYLAAEVGYIDYGTLTYGASVTERPDLTRFSATNSIIDITAAYASAIAFMPFAERWELYVRGAFAYWDASGDQTLITTGTGEVIRQTIDEDGTGFLLGAGVGVSFFSHSHLRLEFRSLATGADDDLVFPGTDKSIYIDGISLEYQYRFGDKWQQ